MLKKIPGYICLCCCMCQLLQFLLIFFTLYYLLNSIGFGPSSMFLNWSAAVVLGYVSQLPKIAVFYLLCPTRSHKSMNEYAEKYEYVTPTTNSCVAESKPLESPVQIALVVLPHPVFYFTIPILSDNCLAEPKCIKSRSFTVKRPYPSKSRNGTPNCQ